MEKSRICLISETKIFKIQETIRGTLKTNLAVPGDGFIQQPRAGRYDHNLNIVTRYVTIHFSQIS